MNAAIANADRASHLAPVFAQYPVEVASADPNILRLLPPFILGDEHVVRLKDALESLG